MAALEEAGRLSARMGKLTAQQEGLFPLQDHMHNFRDCVRTRKTPNCDIIQANLSSALLYCANISYRLYSEKLIIDTKTERMINVEGAVAVENRTDRTGFEIVV